jgi:hypothetical protein
LAEKEGAVGKYFTLFLRFFFFLGLCALQAVAFQGQAAIKPLPKNRVQKPMVGFLFFPPCGKIVPAMKRTWRGRRKKEERRGLEKHLLLSAFPPFFSALAAPLRDAFRSRPRRRWPGLSWAEKSDWIVVDRSQ